jgi:hypothetical protein
MPATIVSAQTLLTGEQMALFSKMQPSEQAHALQMLEWLQAHGETDPDLLVAALLHDTGKQCCPLRLWERVAIVLVQAASPALAQRWGKLELDGCRGWRKPFIVAAQHADWGAELALQAGAKPLVVALIRRHQTPAPADSCQHEDVLLRKLQAVDNQS